MPKNCRTSRLSDLAIVTWQRWISLGVPKPAVSFELSRPAVRRRWVPRGGSIVCIGAASDGMGDIANRTDLGRGAAVWATLLGYVGICARAYRVQSDSWCHVADHTFTVLTSKTLERPSCDSPVSLASVSSRR
jgi:hypothetical protein